MIYANSTDPDQTVHKGAVRLGSTLFSITLSILRNKYIKSKFYAKMVWEKVFEILRHLPYGVRHQDLAIFLHTSSGLAKVFAAMSYIYNVSLNAWSVRQTREISPSNFTFSRKGSRTTFKPQTWIVGFVVVVVVCLFCFKWWGLFLKYSDTLILFHSYPQKCTFIWL